MVDFKGGLFADGRSFGVGGSRAYLLVLVPPSGAMSS